MATANHNARSRAVVHEIPSAAIRALFDLRAADVEHVTLDTRRGVSFFTIADAHSIGGGRFRGWGRS